MTQDSPFIPVYSRQSFFETSVGGEALRRLDVGLGAREPFLLVTGGLGTGKTTLAYEAIARWDSRVTAAFLAYPMFAGAEFIEEILRRFGAEPPEGASRSKLVACFERALAEITTRGQVAILVVDDAHHLSPEQVEELRLLVNVAQQVRGPLEVMLIGLPELEATLDLPALAALRQRVSVHAKLDPLSATETRRYIHRRVTAVGGDGPGLFSRKACRDIATLTGGLPRQINVLAAESLRAARAQGHPTVGLEHVQLAAAALEGFVAAAGVEDSVDDGAGDASAPVARPHPADHDSREWVARFVGDQGPIQISSLARAQSTWAAEPLEAHDLESPKQTETSPKLASWKDGARPDSRSKHSVSFRRVTTAVLAAIVVGVAVMLVIRAGSQVKKPAEAMSTSLARPTEQAPSAATQDAGKTASAVVHGAGSGASRATSSAIVDERRVDGSTSSRFFTIDAGGYSDLETALGERDRLQSLTGFRGWVVPATEGGYRVVLGTYRSQERATAAAKMLLNSQTLSDVTVVPLPPRSERQ